MMNSERILTLASSANEGIKNIENVASALISDSDIMPTDVHGMLSPLLEESLKSRFNSQDELKAKKVLGAALAIAAKKGIPPAGLPENMDSIDIASLADDAMTRVKAAYKVSIGEIDVYEASDKIIDQATARIAAVADRLVAQGVDLAIDKLGMIVAKVFPPALPVVAVIKSIQPLITQKAQQLVRVGIKAVNAMAKQAVRKIGSVVKEKVPSLAKLLS